MNSPTAESKQLLRHSSTQVRTYRPLASRLPILLVFAGLLASYVALIEVLFHRSSKYELSEYASGQPHALTGRNVQWEFVVNSYKQTTQEDHYHSQSMSSATLETWIASNTSAHGSRTTGLTENKHSRAQLDLCILEVLDMPVAKSTPTLARDSLRRRYQTSSKGISSRGTITDRTITITVFSTSTITKTVFETVTIDVTSFAARLVVRADAHDLTSLAIGSYPPPRHVSDARNSLTDRRHQIRNDITTATTPIISVTITITTVTTITVTWTIVQTVTESSSYLYPTSPASSSPMSRPNDSLQPSGTKGNSEASNNPSQTSHETITEALQGPSTSSDRSESSQSPISSNGGAAAQYSTSDSNIHLSSDSSLTSQKDGSNGLQTTSSIETGINFDSAASSVFTAGATLILTSAPSHSSEAYQLPSSETSFTGSSGAYQVYSSGLRSGNVGTGISFDSATSSIFTAGATLILTSAPSHSSEAYQLPSSETSFTGSSGAYQVYSSGLQGDNAGTDHFTKTSTQLSSNTRSSDRSTTSELIRTGANQSLSDSAIDSQKTVSPAASPSVSHVISATSRPIRKLEGSERVVRPPFTHLSYFAAIYLATILAVFAKAYWDIVYSCFKLIEPFEQMSDDRGFPAKRALFAEFLSNTVSWDAWKIMFGGRALPVINLLIYALITAISTIATSSMRVQGMAYCRLDELYVRCVPAWIIETPVLRAIEGLLIASGLFTLFVSGISLAGRSSKLLMNPSSICSIAALFNDEDLKTTISAVEPTASISVFKATTEYQVRLGYCRNALGEQVYGIKSAPALASKDQNIENENSSKNRQRKAYAAALNPAVATFRWSTSDRISLHTQSMFLDAAQLTSTLALLLIVTIYLSDYKSDPFNNFFNSNTWRPPFVSALVAVLVDMQWKRLEREVRITDPYRRLAKGGALPQHTILISLQGTCWSKLPTSIFYLFRYKDMWFQSIVTVVAVLSEFNIIAASTLPFNDGQTWIAVRVTSFLAIAITSLMMIVMLITIFWWRRTKVIRSMPRCPDTIGAVFSYLCGSQMATEFARAGFETLSEKQRHATVVASGKKFRFGQKKCEDGVERWCLDFEDAWKPASAATSTDYFTDMGFDFSNTIGLSVPDQPA